MEYVNLGATGLRVSRVCLGMMSFGNDSDRAWVLDEQAAEPIVRAAVEGGVTFFDTADTYSGGASEVATGRLLRKLLTREEVVVATKVFMPMTPGRERRGTVPQAHPGGDRRIAASGWRWTTWTCTRSTAGTTARRSRRRWRRCTTSCVPGKARYIGASSMFAWQFAKAQHVAELHGLTPFVSMQNHYNLIYREEEREMIPQCIEQGVGVHPVEPAGPRGAGRQPHTRGRAPDHPLGLRPVHRHLYDQPEPTSTWSSAWPRWPASAACPPPRSPWPGCCNGPGSPHRSWAPRSSGISQDALAAERLQLSGRRSRAWRSPTCPARARARIATHARPRQAPARAGRHGRPAGAVRDLVPGGATRRPADAGGSGHRQRLRRGRSVGADGAGQGLRRAGLRVLHQLRQPQGP